MWKIPLYTILFATVFLGGCNWGKNAVDETPVENTRNDIRRDVNDAENDVQRGVNDVEDALDPNRNNDVYDRDVNGTDRGTINNDGVNPNVTNPNSNADINSTNGVDGNVTVPSDKVNREDIIEDKADRQDRNNVDNR